MLVPAAARDLTDPYQTSIVHFNNHIHISYSNKGSLARRKETPHSHVQGRPLPKAPSLTPAFSNADTKSFVIFQFKKKTPSDSELNEWVVDSAAVATVVKLLFLLYVASSLRTAERIRGNNDSPSELN